MSLGGVHLTQGGLGHRLPQTLAGNGSSRLRVTVAEIVADQQVSLSDATVASVLRSSGVLGAAPLQGGLEKASHPSVLLGSGLQNHFKLAFHFSGEGKKKKKKEEVG